MQPKPISRQTLQRMPLYLNYLRSLPLGSPANISAATIAEELRLNDVQVRKDLAMLGRGGRPKIGFDVKDLITNIEHCLGYDNINHAVLVGVGNLGRSLFVYEGFLEYGIDIVAAFDMEDEIVGTTIYKKQVLPLSKLEEICCRMKIKMGVITVNAAQAQLVCDQMVKSGVIAIWNFTPVILRVPEKVLVQNENMASSLAILSNHLAERYQSE